MTTTQDNSVHTSLYVIVTGEKPEVTNSLCPHTITACTTS